MTTRVPYSMSDAPVNVRAYGAKGDGIADDTAAIQAAIDAANGVFFPSGNYLVNDQIDLKSDLLLFGEGGSKIVLDSGVTPYVLRGSATNNVTIRDLEIEGNGASGFSTVYITNATNVTVDNCKVTKSGATALYFVNCLFAKVQNCTLSNNFYYGLEFRDCDGCKAIANQCVSNGATGVATSTGGRGIMLWRSRGCYIAGNRFVTNNEYGFRIYSEAADTTASYNNVITGNVFVDNVRVDLVLYDEGAAFSFVSSNVISDNVFYRTVDTTDINSVCVLHGDFNTYVNNHIKKSGAFGTDCGFNFYNANYCTISNCSVENMDVAFSTSSSTNITIDNCFGNGVGAGLTIPTTGIVVKNCNFIKGGPSAVTTCINNTGATGKNFYEGNRIVNFNRGIYSAGEAVAIYRNTTTGCAVGFQLDGTSIANLECGQNSWDSANRNELYGLSKTVYGLTFSIDAALPVTINFPLGSIFYLNSPSVGNPYQYVKRGAALGDWTSVGNL